MKKIVIIYTSVHHKNTQKLLYGMREKVKSKTVKIDLIPSDKIMNQDFSKYDIVGFASGIYMGHFHKSILDCIGQSYKFPKASFVICTSGSTNKKYLLRIQELLRQNGFTTLGGFQCKGYDTYGIFKMIGGIAKGHPNEKDILNAKDFIERVLEQANI